ncbi:tyrosine-type recombinase/integrase [Ruegeria sp.]|uniref:tyrosine-type recombinase/integrase n=1 Tax=Ruegeria sp. TaxID=1879320 RepID=UPI003C79C679
MGTQRVKFTEGSIEKLPFSTAGTDRYADIRKGVFPNLYLDVGTKSKTWRLVKFAHGKTKSKTLGKWPAMNLHQAAQAAESMAERVADATHALPAPDAHRSKEITLKEAFLRHTTERVDPRTKEKSPNTIYDYLSTLQNHAGPKGEWLDVPIDEITRPMINAQIKALKDSPAQATKLLRILSAIYRNEMLIRDDVIEDPTFRIRAYASKPKELLFDPSGRWPALDAVMEVEDVTMRAVWLVMLFTGIRSTNVRNIEWSDLDLERNLLTIPRLKNGTKRTFPLSSVASAALRRIPRIHDDLVFASKTKAGVPITHQQALGSPKVLRQHDTRHLFTSAGSMAGIDRSKVKYLRGDIVLGDGADVGYMHGIAAHEDVEKIGQLIAQKSSTPYSQLVAAIETN